MPWLPVIPRNGIVQGRQGDVGWDAGGRKGQLLISAHGRVFFVKAPDIIPVRVFPVVLKKLKEGAAMEIGRAHV